MDWDKIWAVIDNFVPKEFDDPEVKNSWQYMDYKTILGLEWLRKNTGWPIVTHIKFGLRGCVCVEPKGHSDGSFHYITNPEGCSAVDWHFVTDADPREQAAMVLKSVFTGVGIYQNVWKWKGELLPIAFHTDKRKRFQVWKREAGKYIYLLK